MRSSSTLKVDVVVSSRVVRVSSVDIVVVPCVVNVAVDVTVVDVAVMVVFVALVVVEDPEWCVKSDDDNATATSPTGTAEAERQTKPATTSFKSRRILSWRRGRELGRMTLGRREGSCGIAGRVGQRLAPAARSCVYVKGQRCSGQCALLAGLLFRRASTWTQT
ncbi:hypothetical protein BC831DRAFT_481587 [Entophlyctis helioformis]|nr:hypothetical protein BC831DRAFT_481587 [Entophlyctis helioformis]